MQIDADGANGQTGGVPVYAPKGFTPAPLDFLANAGEPGNWFPNVKEDVRGAWLASFHAEPERMRSGDEHSVCLDILSRICPVSS